MQHQLPDKWQLFEVILVELLNKYYLTTKI